MTSIDSEGSHLQLESDTDLEAGNGTTSSRSTADLTTDESITIPSQIDTDRLFFFHSILLNPKKVKDEFIAKRFQKAAEAGACCKIHQVDATAASCCPYDLSTRNLTYKVNIRKRGNIVVQKVLLDNITAEARHGEVLAIMGPSGASKSTLLDALAGRISRQSMSGSILVNGEPMTCKFKRISGYVMQDDVHFPVLTARETLTFSAQLRLPNSVSTGEKMERVEAILELLGLTACADTRIGNEEVGGVSGGERRRISIALDLIHDPMVLLLDEPTSGLDSTSALQVMNSLSKLAKERKRTIVLTIHQPSYRILDTIDNSLVLAKGNVVYHGHHNDMIKFFSDLGFVKPEHVTVVEYMMDKIEGCDGNLGQLLPQRVSTNAQSSKKRVSSSHPDGDAGRFKSEQRALSSKDYTEDYLCLDTDVELPEAQPEDGGPAESLNVRYANSIWKETWILSNRNFLNTLRTRTLFLSRILIVLFTNVVMATLFYNSDRDEEGFQQRRVFFAFTIAILVFTSSEAMPVFLMERRIFVRETSRGAYRASSYVLSYSMVVLPIMLLLAMLGTVTSYFAVGLVRKPDAIFFFGLVIFLVLLIGNAFVAFLSALVPNFISGLILFGASTSYWFLFCGFFIPRRSIPKYWSWLHYTSFFKYPYEALMENELRNLPEHIWFRSLTSQRLLSTLDCKGDIRHQWLNVLYMIGFFVGYRLLFYLTLRFQTNNIRR